MTDLERAAQVMAEATSWFVLPSYGLEGLLALVAAGWTITPPAGGTERGTTDVH